MSRLFAEVIDSQVVAVLVVNDEDCLDADGEFSEEIGANFLREVYRDGLFVETRDDGSIRRFPAGIGSTYLADLDEFRPEQPADTWIWDDDLGRWINPDAESEPDET